ncbi:MAG: hypothetical protein QXG98_03860 [Candidatus Micrarchaeia archaeon]
MQLPNIYAGDYRRLVLAPIFLLLIAAFFIPRIPQGIELRGGILITIQANGSVDAAALERALSQAGVREVSVALFQNPLGTVVEVSVPQEPSLAEAERAVKEFYHKYDELTRAEYELTSWENALRQPNAPPNIQSSLESARAKAEAARTQFLAVGERILSASEALLGPIPRPPAPSSKEYKELVDASFSRAKEAYRNRLLAAIGSSLTYSSLSFKDVSPTLSEFFLQKAVTVVLFSALLSAVVVFLVFRTFIPSLAVLTGAASDIVIALGAMGAFGIPLTLPSFAALLMLIGFSLDTDVLLTMRTLKRTEGTPRQRAYETMKTGATMSLAALVAFSVLLALALLTHIPTYYQIASVAIAGLLGDLVATWGLNAVIILWYLESRGM